MQRWNINYLQELHNKYLRKSIETTDATLSLEYESTANSVLTIIDRYDELVHKKRQFGYSEIVNFRRVIEDDFWILDNYGIYCPYISQINNLNNSLIINPNSDLPVIDTSLSKVLTVSKDFYDSIGGIFSKKFNTMSKRFKDTLHVVRLGSNIVTNGQTYSVYKTDITFVELGVNKTAQDYVSAIHEFGHGISCAINPTAMFDFGKYCFIELESLFFELLSLDYLEDKLALSNDSFDIGMQILKDYLYAAQIICNKMNMYEELNERQLYHKASVKKYLARECGYSPIGIKDVLSTSMRDYFHYIISYLTAIELYLIYQTDSKLALDLLYKVIISKQEYSIGYLDYVKSLGLEPGKNINTYIEILFNKAKDLNDDKSLRYQN